MSKKTPQKPKSPRNKLKKVKLGEECPKGPHDCTAKHLRDLNEEQW
jgi:hypothetical protein